MWRVRALAVWFLVSMACSPIAYQRAGSMGGFGYDDIETAPGQFQVIVRGNTFTDMQTLGRYFHRRADELCRARGAAHYTFQLQTEKVQDKIFIPVGVGASQRLEAIPLDRAVVAGSVSCVEMVPVSLDPGDMLGSSDLPEKGAQPKKKAKGKSRSGKGR